MKKQTLVFTNGHKGFSLLELIVAVAIVGILAAIALPSYHQYIVRASREAAQIELLDLATLQEKIYLNSNAYATRITTAYNGTAAGGLGKSSGKTNDGKYALTINPNTGTSQTYTITATPVPGQGQTGDGDMTINQDGQRAWKTTYTW